LLVGDELRVVDPTYQFLDREIENQVPLAFAAKYGIKFGHSNLSMEGGNCLSNGKGLCISTTMLIEQNKVRGYDLQTVGAILMRDFRFQQWSYLPPLIGEPTGHVDMYVTLTSPSSVIVGSFDPAIDAENAKLLDQAADTLSKVTVDDKPLEVSRMPMPSHRDGKWRTYTNVIYANGVLLVPQYPNYCPEFDRQAMEIYRKLMPEWKVVGIDASELIEKRGSLHCLSLNLPVMPSLRAEQHQ
jgi:agmatine/peptidylarginine deiminase